jgi:hypothetical protein
MSSDTSRRFQLGVRLIDLHGVRSVHSYRDNRHHICNL